ncbi:hypothetical protein EBS02_01030 [bacterium]|nr:hypothetical protein [bacterium]
MDRKFHIVSIEDREMFAYNAAYNERQRILSHPEERIKYCFEFLKDYENDENMKKKCYDNLAKYSAKVDYSEAHF